MRRKDPKKAKEKKPAAKPDALVKTTDEDAIELTEDDLGRVSGGMSSFKFTIDK